MSEKWIKRLLNVWEMSINNDVNNGMKEVAKKYQFSWYVNKIDDMCKQNLVLITSILSIPVFQLIPINNSTQLVTLVETKSIMSKLSKN